MYYEEKIIDGILCCRNTPDGKWMQLTDTLRITSALDALAEMQAERALMTQEIDVMLAFLEARKESKTEEIDDQIERLTAEIKHLVIEHGKSVKASVLHRGMVQAARSVGCQVS